MVIPPIYPNPCPNDSHLLDYCFLNPEWAIKCYYRNQHDIRRLWNWTIIGLPPFNIPTRVHTPQLHPQPHLHPQLQLPHTIQPHVILPIIPQSPHKYLEFSPLSSINSSSANELNQSLNQPVYRILNGRIVRPQTDIPPQPQPQVTTYYGSKIQVPQRFLEQQIRPQDLQNNDIEMVPISKNIFMSRRTHLASRRTVLSCTSHVLGHNYIQLLVSDAIS